MPMADYAKFWGRQPMQANQSVKLAYPGTVQYLRNGNNPQYYINARPRVRFWGMLWDARVSKRRREGKDDNS